MKSNMSAGLRCHLTQPTENGQGIVTNTEFLIVIANLASVSKGQLGNGLYSRKN